MKLEVGRYYRTRDGRKVGPMAIYQSGVDMWDDPTGSLQCDSSAWWTGEGVRGGFVGGHPHDLICEWVDTPAGPVITETVKRIVPGVYGKVVVCDGDELCVVCDGMRTKADLIAARDVFNALIDAMEE